MDGGRDKSRTMPRDPRSHHPTVAISYYLIHGSAGGDKINNTSTTPSQRGQLAGKYFWRAPLFSLPPACTIVVRAVPHRDIDAYGLLEITAQVEVVLIASAACVPTVLGKTTNIRGVCFKHLRGLLN